MSVPDDLVKNVKKLNSVFKDVVSTREAAIDAEGFQLLSAIGKELAETSAGELVFDPNVFAEKLVSESPKKNREPWCKILCVEIF